MRGIQGKSDTDYRRLYNEYVMYAPSPLDARHWSAEDGVARSRHRARGMTGMPFDVHPRRTGCWWLLVLGCGPHEATEPNPALDGASGLPVLPHLFSIHPELLLGTLGFLPNSLRPCGGERQSQSSPPAPAAPRWRVREWPSRRRYTVHSRDRSEYHRPPHRKSRGSRILLRRRG